MTKTHILLTGGQTYLSRKHKADQKIFLGRGGGGQQDFPVMPTRLEIELGLSKEELNLGKSLQWDAFSQEERDYITQLDFGSPAHPLHQPGTARKAIRLKNYLCWYYWAAFHWIHSLSRSPVWVQVKPFLYLY